MKVISVLRLRMLGNNFSTQHFEIFLLFFQDNRLTFHANCLNLQEMLKPILGKKKKNMSV